MTAATESPQSKRITPKCDVDHGKAGGAIAFRLRRLQIANTVLRVLAVMSLVILAGTADVRGASAVASASVTVAAPAAEVRVTTAALLAAAAAGELTAPRAISMLEIVDHRQKFTLDVTAGSKIAQIAGEGEVPLSRGTRPQSVAITLHMN